MFAPGFCLQPGRAGLKARRDRVFVGAADDFENGDRLGFAFHHDFAQLPEIVSADQALPCSFTDEDPRSALLVQRLQAGSQVDGSPITV
jgi:hypothetical protein